MHVRKTHKFWIIFGLVFILILGASVISAAPTAYTLDFSAYTNGTDITTLTIDGFTFSSTGTMQVWNSGAYFVGTTNSMKLAVDATAISFQAVYVGGWCLPGNYWYVELLKNGSPVYTSAQWGCNTGYNFSYSGAAFDEFTVRSVGYIGVQSSAFNFTFVDAFPPVAPTGSTRGAVEVDADDDGLPYYQDNCANVYNPSQEDGWGSAMGDACDTEWYNASGRGLAGYEQKDGMFNLYGNCDFMADGAAQCPVVASFDPTQFSPENMPVLVTAATANGWTVWIYYLHSNHGPDVYQANVYDAVGNLVDDRLELHVSGGSYQWFMRGGDSQYHGN